VKKEKTENKSQCGCNNQKVWQISLCEKVTLNLLNLLFIFLVNEHCKIGTLSWHNIVTNNVIWEHLNNARWEPFHIVAMSHGNIETMPGAYIFTLQQCHMGAFSHCGNLTWEHCNNVTWEHFHIVAKSHGNIVTMPDGNTFTF